MGENAREEDDVAFRLHKLGECFVCRDIAALDARLDAAPPVVNGGLVDF